MSAEGSRVAGPFSQRLVILRERRGGVEGGEMERLRRVKEGKGEGEGGERREGGGEGERKRGGRKRNGIHVQVHVQHTWTTS